MARNWRQMRKNKWWNNELLLIKCIRKPSIFRLHCFSLLLSRIRFHVIYNMRTNMRISEHLNQEMFNDRCFAFSFHSLGTNQYVYNIYFDLDALQRVYNFFPILHYNYMNGIGWILFFSFIFVVVCLLLMCTIDSVSHTLTNVLLFLFSCLSVFQSFSLLNIYILHITSYSVTYKINFHHIYKWHGTMHFAVVWICINLIILLTCLHECGVLRHVTRCHKLS